MNEFIKMSSDWKRNMMILDQERHEVIRLTLNAQAMEASKQQRFMLDKMFILRTKFTAGSIFPRVGKRLGLIPAGKSDTNRMFSRSGTIQEYLADQEDGYSRTDPKVPTNKARVAKSKKRRISSKNKLKRLRREKTIKPTGFKNITNREDKIRAMLGLAKSVNWKGVLKIEKMNNVLPAGYYRLKGRSLQLIRYEQKGIKKRKAHEWHNVSIKKGERYIFSQVEFDSIMNKKLSKLK